MQGSPTPWTPGPVDGVDKEKDPPGRVLALYGTLSRRGRTLDLERKVNENALQVEALPVDIGTQSHHRRQCDVVRRSGDSDAGFGSDPRSEHGRR